ncbi:MAG: hydroxysqualene dehydroxylase HpnE [Acidobacteriia bacterium]|nr:hydroxysqualene dehydroxylase HpnE [Terriglobia bacterium]
MNAAPKVAIAGAGLAGLSAGCALADAGFQVTILEKRPYVGGRASSYEHPGTGEVVDNCQHVLLGCCTNLIDFYRRIGVEQKIRWYDRLTFLEPGGRRSDIEPSFLPAPFHNTLSFLAAHSLGLGDKMAIGHALMSIMRNLPEETDEPFLAWLKSKRQTQRAIDRFWKVVLVSALNEDLDRMSIRYAAQVFRESFLKSAAGGRMGIPNVPLTELYGAAGEYIRTRGGEVRLRAGVDAIKPEANGARLCVTGGELLADYAISALPFQALEKVLPQDDAAGPLRRMLGRFETSPITGIHFWFDRQITDLEHAVLLDRTIQWMFHKSKLHAQGSEAAHGGSYVELVVSSSKSLVDKSRNDILDLALRELEEFFPGVANAKVLKSTVIKELHATYSALPESDEYRPGNGTAWPRLFLAGDWTATGWPATMEGAVRSGYMAAEALTKAISRTQRFLIPDLPPSGLMRLFG